MILGQIAFGTILTVTVFSTWIKLLISNPDHDEFTIWYATSTVVDMLEHAAFIVLAIKYLIERGVI